MTDNQCNAGFRRRGMSLGNGKYRNYCRRCKTPLSVSIECRHNVWMACGGCASDVKLEHDYRPNSWSMADPNWATDESLNGGEQNAVRALEDCQ